MGTCVAKQTRPDGKPEEEQEAPDVYTNEASYFIRQVIALITHETYKIDPDIEETLLLTHIFFSNSYDLLTAISERFFITYERYKFTTYQRECDISIFGNNINTNNNKIKVDTMRPMKKLQTSNMLNNSAGYLEQQASNSSLSTSLNETKTDNNNNNNNNKKTNSKPKSLRNRSGTIDIGYIPTSKLDLNEWIINIKIPIQQKCLNLLLKWIENYWIEDFGDNDVDIDDDDIDDKDIYKHQEIIKLLTKFIDDIKKSRDQFQNISNNKKKNKKKPNSNKSTHAIYAGFLQSFILKFDNIIATQQKWYKNIVNELRKKQKEQERLWIEQIKTSKKFKRNRLNSTMKDNHVRSISANSVSTFSDTLFNSNIMETLNQMDDDDNKSIANRKKSKRISLSHSKNKNINMKRKSLSQSKSKSAYNYINDKHQSNNNDDHYIGNTLSFISMKNQENAAEYAKQLTFLDWESFNAINRRSCLYKVLKKKKVNKYKSVSLFIDRFQQTHQYVIVSIIAAPNLKSRIEMIEFFIYVSEMLLKLNNLYSFMAVITALDSIQCQKLKISWEYINKSNLTKFKTFLSPLCSVSKNYAKLREYSSLMKSPGIPFLGLILKDLTFTNDGNKNKLNKIINFNKYKLFYSIINKNIIYFKSNSYNNKIKHSKQFESQDINALVKKLNINNDNDGSFDEQHSPIHHDNSDDDNDDISPFDTDHDDIKSNNDDLIPDKEFQEQILKDLNSYILLNKNVIRAMTHEANRIDIKHKDEYINEYLSPKLTPQVRRGSGSYSNNSQSGSLPNNTHSNKKNKKSGGGIFSKLNLTKRSSQSSANSKNINKQKSKSLHPLKE